MEVNITTKEIPSEVLNEAKQLISNFSTGLIYKGDLIGSGTYIKHGNKYGILTAYHVVDETRIPFNMDSTEKLGLSVTNDVHTFEIELKYCMPIIIETTGNDGYGPDLTFIEILDQQKIGTIKACRSFWSIDDITTAKYEDSQTNGHGIWAISGFPYESRVLNGTLLTLPGIVGFSGIEKRVQKDQYDYLELSVNYSSSDELPINFEGISGGGLWKVPITIKMNSNKRKFKMDHPILSGVVFYQTELNNNHRFLRCHGPISIYEQLSSRIKQL